MLVSLRSQHVAMKDVFPIFVKYRVKVKTWKNFHTFLRSNSNLAQQTPVVFIIFSSFAFLFDMFLVKMMLFGLFRGLLVNFQCFHVGRNLRTSSVKTFGEQTITSFV